MSDLGFDNNATAGITAAVAGTVIYFVRTLIRRGAKDMSEIKTEMSQSDYMSTLRADNEKLRQDIETMAKERNDALSRVGALEAEIGFVKQQCATKARIIQRCPVIQSHDSNTEQLILTSALPEKHG